jgi:hypothetical protein
MTDVDLLQAHLRGDHRATANEACPACKRVSAGQRPGAGSKGPKKARKTSKRHLPCECGCGAHASPGSRFLPGHDAKLKRRLTLGALNGRPDDWVEMVVRGWDRLVPPHKLPPRDVLDRAWTYLDTVLKEPRIQTEWLAARNAIRASH